MTPLDERDEKGGGEGKQGKREIEHVCYCISRCRQLCRAALRGRVREIGKASHHGVMSALGITMSFLFHTEKVNSPVTHLVAMIIVPRPVGDISIFYN